MEWKILSLLLCGAGFIYLLIKKPEIIAVVLFTIVLSQINITYIRPVLTLALFGRIMLDKETQAVYPSFLSLPYVKLLIVFLIYGLFVALSEGLFDYDLLKAAVDSIMLSYCVYHFYFKSQGDDQLKAALIISGLICFGDLAYTYMVYGSFPIHRLYNLFTGPADEVVDVDMFTGINWNYFGQMCGMAFVFVLRDYVRGGGVKKYLLWILPLMLIGVVMSTSRSAILALLILTIFIILNGIKYKEQKRKIFRFSAFLAGFGLIAILLLSVVSKSISLDSKFIDEITTRLTDEPVAIFRKAMGQSYNINNLGSMNWREESAANAYAAYMKMSYEEQVFGIGTMGFEKRNIGHGFNAHNATLLLLIENGIIGLLIYFIFIAGVIIKSIRVRNFSPSLMVIIFILIYGLGQNREWTSWTMYLFVFCVVAELQEIRISDSVLNLNNRMQKKHAVL